MKDNEVQAEVAKLIRTIPDPDLAAVTIVLFVRSHRPRAGGKSVGPKPGVRLIVFPCVGMVKDWRFTTGERDDLADLYPGIDVLSEARKALAWIEGNPTRRKTAGGMRRFIVGWLNREQNQSRRAEAAAPPKARSVADQAEETSRRLREQNEAAALSRDTWKDR